MRVLHYYSYALSVAGVSHPDIAQFQATVTAALPSYIDTLDDLTILFNTQSSESTTQGNLKSVTFEKTPIPISSYLVAFAIGDFDYLEQMSNGIRYRVYCSPGKEEYGKFALNVTVSLIEYWEDLFDVPYPFSKLDQIAVPKIVEDGMENMGSSPQTSLHSSASLSPLSHS